VKRNYIALALIVLVFVGVALLITGETSCQIEHVKEGKAADTWIRMRGCGAEVYKDS